jgi:hypothetical protein
MPLLGESRVVLCSVRCVIVVRWLYELSQSGDAECNVVYWIVVCLVDRVRNWNYRSSAMQMPRHSRVQETIEKDETTRKRRRERRRVEGASVTRQWECGAIRFVSFGEIGLNFRETQTNDASERNQHRGKLVIAMGDANR